jgi:hypothetical protein
MSIRPIRLFVVCADTDDPYLREFEKHLSTLQRQQLIDTWHQGRTAAGDDLSAQISMHLDQADIIVLAVSADFIASDYIHDVQLVRAIQRHTEGSARVIPLLLRPVSWRLTSFGHLSPLPRDGRAVDMWPHKDEAWLDVVNEIERIVSETRQGMTLAVENTSLRAELSSVLARDQELLLQNDALTKELAALRDTHRRFDVEVEAACAELRAAAQNAQMQVAELTVRLGETLRDLDFHRNRADKLSSQRQEQSAQVSRLTEELKDLRSTRELLIWKSEAHVYVFSGGVQDDGKKFAVTWAFAVENTGRHAVRLIEAQVTWCFVDPNEPSTEPTALHTDPYVSSFSDRPIVEPGQRSESYLVKVNTKDIDPENAQEMTSTIQPSVLVVYERIPGPYRSSSERLLERENHIPQ